MSKDALDQKIEALQEEATGLRERLAEIDLKLSIYEEAARLRPVDVAAQNTARRRPTPTPQESGSSKRGGRQPGAISRKWQIILKGVAAHYPDGATPADIASF